MSYSKHKPGGNYRKEIRQPISRVSYSKQKPEQHYRQDIGQPTSKEREAHNMWSGRINVETYSSPNFAVFLRSTPTGCLVCIKWKVKSIFTVWFT